MTVGGEGGAPGQWDDELSSWPEPRRHVAARRIAFGAVCAALVTLIILTIVFVGNDKTSSARVTTNVTSSSTTSTLGFATALPAAATATSFATTATTTESTSTTTTTTVSRSTTTTSTTSPPPFQYKPNPKTATAVFSNGDPACYPPPNDKWLFDTSTPGRLRITHENNSATGTGTVGSDGTFGVITATDTAMTVTEHYSGQTSQTQAVGTFELVGCPPADVTFTLT